MSRHLHLESLAFRYPHQQNDALDEITLDVAPGQLLAVVGPSGSGKSTLLRVVAGLLRPDRGDVQLGGRSLVAVPPERRGISMMFQKPLLFPHLDVLDNVAFADRTAGMPRARARSAARSHLDVVRLGDLASRRPRELSGGQEQRVALARALAPHPQVLLLDEPFSALDPELQVAMHDLLKQVRARFEPTTMMVTHDLGEAAMADKVAVLDDGRVVQHDTIDELYRRPASVTVARLLGGFSELVGTAVDGGYECALGVVTTASPFPDGRSVVLVRQESVTIVDEHDPHVAATGLVVGATRAGTRQVATVEVEGARAGGRAAAVLVELAPGVPAPIGARVRVQLTGPLVHVPAGSDVAPARADVDRPSEGAVDGARVGDRQ